VAAASVFQTRLKSITDEYTRLIRRKNPVDASWSNGWYTRHKYPVLTNRHVPLFWRYDLNPETNPFFIERLGINAVFNAGAIEFDGKICVVARVEGFDRKSFFAVARSDNGVDNFVFDDYPVVFDEAPDPDTNVYDMRLTRHEDGWIYGLFCTERKDPCAPASDTSAAVAACGIVRTKDLRDWQRLPDLVSDSPQQRNVVLHPELINGKYALYTRPQDDFIKAGTGGGIGWALCGSMENAVIHEEKIMDPRVYHTITEVKNGMGAPPVKTAEGWLHVAHGVRNTAAGLRYVLYSFLCDLNDPSKIIAHPGGYFLAPEGEERVGDVSNVAFSNGMVARANGDIFIYYASSDTRLHVAKTSTAVILDYVKNTPPDPHYTLRCVKQRVDLIRKNLAFVESHQPLKKAKKPVPAKKGRKR